MWTLALLAEYGDQGASETLAIWHKMQLHAQDKPTLNLSDAFIEWLVQLAHILFHETSHIPRPLGLHDTLLKYQHHLNSLTELSLTDQEKILKRALECWIERRLLLIQFMMQWQQSWPRIEVDDKLIGSLENGKLEELDVLGVFGQVLHYEQWFLYHIYKCECALEQLDFLDYIYHLYLLRRAWRQVVSLLASLDARAPVQVEPTTPERYSLPQQQTLPLSPTPTTASSRTKRSSFWKSLWRNSTESVLPAPSESAATPPPPVRRAKHRPIRVWWKSFMEAQMSRGRLVFDTIRRVHEAPSYLDILQSKMVEGVRSFWLIHVTNALELDSVSVTVCYAWHAHLTALPAKDALCKVKNALNNVTLVNENDVDYLGHAITPHFIIIAAVTRPLLENWLEQLVISLRACKPPFQ